MGRLVVVLLDAEAVGVEFPEQRHRLGVALLFDPPGRNLERCQIEAALHGAKGEIDLAAGQRGGSNAAGAGAVAGAETAGVSTEGAFGLGCAAWSGVPFDFGLGCVACSGAPFDFGLVLPLSVFFDRGARLGVSRGAGGVS